MANKSNWPNKDLHHIWVDPNKRFNEIRQAYNCLDDTNFPSFDADSFAYHTKMLFENRHVYCSQAAWNLIQQHKTSCGFEPTELEKLKNGGIQDTYLQNKTHKFKDKTNATDSLIWEHVVPINLLIDELKKNFSEQQYLNLMNKYGNVCIITKSEDHILTANGLRKKMPQGWCFSKNANEWARYDQVGIKCVQ